LFETANNPVQVDEVQNVTQWGKWVLTGYELNRAFFTVTHGCSQNHRETVLEMDGGKHGKIRLTIKMVDKTTKICLSLVVVNTKKA